MAGTISESQTERCAANQSLSLCSARSRRKARPPCGNPSNAIGSSARAIAQQVEVILLAARLLRLLDRDPADDAVLVDDERASLGVPGLAEEDAVLLRHVPLRVEIGEQRRAQSLVALERAQAPPVVHGYADHRRVLALVFHPAGPDLFQLLRTDGREGGGEEDDDDVAAAEAGKAGGLALLVEQLEIRGDVADLKHGSLPWMRASFAGFGRARKCAAVGRAALLQFTTPSAVLVAWAGRRIFACEAVERLLASGLPQRPRSRNFPVGGYEHAVGCKDAVADWIRAGADRRRGGQVHQPARGLGSVPEPQSGAAAPRRRAHVHAAGGRSRDRGGAARPPAPARRGRGGIGLARGDRRQSSLDGQVPGHRGARRAAGSRGGSVGDDAGVFPGDAKAAHPRAPDADGPGRDDPAIGPLRPRFT